MLISKRPDEELLEEELLVAELSEDLLEPELELELELLVEEEAAAEGGAGAGADFLGGIGPLSFFCGFNPQKKLRLSPI